MKRNKRSATPPSAGIPMQKKVNIVDQYDEQEFSNTVRINGLQNTTWLKQAEN
jgi:hypothetical protein